MAAVEQMRSSVDGATTVLDVAVIGAGPFGLSVAAHLAQHHRVRVYGRPMDTWRTLMPPDMLLRSDWDHTNLSAPTGGSLDHFVAQTGETKREPTPLQLFLRYGDWFRDRFVPDSDPADVSRVEMAGEHFRITTESTPPVLAKRLVLAVGVTPFPRTLESLRDISDPRINFAVSHRSFERYRGHRVVIVGGGQNGLESAALTARAGAASVEILVRSRVRWYAPREPYSPRGPLASRIYRLAYPVVGFGPPPLNRIVFHPDLFSRLPETVRERINRRLLRAGGSPWIRDQVDGVIPIRENCEVVAVDPRPDALHLRLSDGTVREVDDVIIAAGYRFDLERLRFLDPELRRTIRVHPSTGWPVLNRYMCSTNRRIFFAGYPAEGQFGPLTRYVEGTRFAAVRIASSLAQQH